MGPCREDIDHSKAPSWDGGLRSSSITRAPRAQGISTTLALCQEVAPNGSLAAATGRKFREPGATNPTVRGEAATAGTPGSSSFVTLNGPSGTLKLRILQA